MKFISERNQSEMRKLNKRAAHILHPDRVMIVSAHTYTDIHTLTQIERKFEKRESNKDKMQSSCAALACEMS